MSIKKWWNRFVNGEEMPPTPQELTKRVSEVERRLDFLEAQIKLFERER